MDLLRTIVAYLPILNGFHFLLFSKLKSIYL